LKFNHGFNIVTLRWALPRVAFETLKTMDSSPDLLGRECFDVPYETVATVPIDRDAPNEYDDDVFETTFLLSPGPLTGVQNTYGSRQTQPTQLVNRSSSQTTTVSSPHKSVVQVAASSPTPAPAPVRRPGGILASAMAPAGTVFRVPHGVTKAPRRPPVIDISDDDGPSYRGGSSDSDTAQLRKHDIKTSSFGRRGQDSTNKVEESPQVKPGSSKFQAITANSVYKPQAKGANLSGSVFDSKNRTGDSTTSSVVTGSTAVKRSSDTMTNAYGGISRDSKKPRQVGPSRALPVIRESTSDMSLDDIDDYQVRQKVKRMKALLTAQTIRSCYEALTIKRGRFDDAVDWLVAKSEAQESPQNRHIDLTGSEDELMPTPIAPKYQQPIRAPIKTIQEKWGSSQVPKKPLSQKSNDAVEPVKKGGRLVRGRKKASSPTVEEPQPPQRKITHQIESSDSDEADSGHPSGNEDVSLGGRVLAFFNTCSPADLVDITGKSMEVACYLLSKRPFKSLRAVRNVPAPESKSKRKAPIGDAIVDKCEEMIVSYEAVDFLVKKCEAIGKPIAQQMKQWGVNVYGQKDGELDLVSLGDSHHDSGIGTPTSEHDGKGDPTKLGLIPQPATMGDHVQLKDYQIVGVNWLALLYKQSVSAILADDMGLGKTCQVIAFLAHLLETGEPGPHLVVVPASTLENWLTEFRKFCPALVVEPYYGSQAERAELRFKIDSYDRGDINVIITTYATAKGKDDFPWLKNLDFCYTIFDEGHALKNADSQVYEKLIRIKSRFRLLLTGTPLQNNLQELISLLAFLMPDIFKSRKDDLQAIFTHKVKALDSNHEALLSAQRIARARSMLTPFILRRKKHQVLKHLPAKTRRVEFCEMADEQLEIYQEQQQRAQDVLIRRAAGEQMGNESANILIELRKAAIHPLLFHRLYTDDQLRALSKACLKEDQWRESNPDLIFTELLAYSDMEVHQLCMGKPSLRKFLLRNDEWMSSGKVKKLCELLVQFKREGHRTLIFSQFIMVMDVLELVLHNADIEYLRLDGSTPVAVRQDMIDDFNAEDSIIPVFMLSTRAGGAGVNLTGANKVIVFDSGFNPQDDIQAENRAHRIGQQKDVEIIRLVSAGTVEEQIYAMGLTKLALDDKVAGDEDEQKENDRKRAEAEGQKMVEELLFKKLETEPEEVKSAIVGGGVKVKAESVALPGRFKEERTD
jgi:SWI/SNF-related matrix-associated actin-dependent regulator of chromatin subfamily A containing DEAD/H box 1